MIQEPATGAVRIEKHPPEGGDAGAWLRYGVALLQTIEPNPEAGKQQQQAALAFLQAIKEGASEAEVSAAQLDAVVGNLRMAIDVVGLGGDHKG